MSTSPKWGCRLRLAIETTAATAEGNAKPALISCIDLPAAGRACAFLCGRLHRRRRRPIAQGRKQRRKRVQIRARWCNHLLLIPLNCSIVVFRNEHSGPRKGGPRRASTASIPRDELTPASDTSSLVFDALLGPAPRK